MSQIVLTAEMDRNEASGPPARHYLRKVGGSAFAVLAMTVLAWGTPDPVSASTETFRGQLVATESRTPDPICGGLHIVSEGQGSATRLGDRIDAALDECVNLIREPGRAHVKGIAVLRVPSGDELRLEYTLAGALPDPVTGAVHAPGTYAVIGGTGRFARASGSGKFVGDTNLFSDQVRVTWEGSLLTR